MIIAATNPTKLQAQTPSLGTQLSSGGAPVGILERALSSRGEDLRLTDQPQPLVEGSRQQPPGRSSNDLPLANPSRKTHGLP